MDQFLSFLAICDDRPAASCAAAACLLHLVISRLFNVPHFASQANFSLETVVAKYSLKERL